jgi:hypothetical protein
MEQLPDARIVPPDKATELPPLVIVTVPPQVFDEKVAAVFFILVEGYVSVKAAPVTAVVFGLVRVMVKLEAPLISIVAGMKPLTAVGGANTVSVVVAAVPGNVFAVVIVPVLFE